MSFAVNARLFGPGSPSTGEPAELTVTAQSLDVRSAQTSHRVPLADLRVRTVGVDQSGLEFSWHGDEGARAVQVTDAHAVHALRASPVLSTAPQLVALRTKQRRAGIGRSLGWSVLAILVLLPLLLLAAFFWQADRIAAALSSRIPVEQEIQLGEQAFEAMRATLTLQESGPAYDAVTTIGKRLSTGSRYTYRFYVAKNSQINAFALPGGIIVVYTGLIEATRRPEELAGVLAHEIQHVEQRHSLNAAIKNLGLRGLWALVTGDIGGAIFGKAAVRLLSLSFSRDAERDADSHGFDTLVEQDIDPAGMADFFKVLGEKQANGPAFLSTHPGSEDREKALRARLDELKGRQFKPLEFGSWPPL